MLAGNLFSGGENRIGASKINDDAALFNPAAGPADDFAFTNIEFLEDDVPFGVSDFLDDDLLGRLGGDATKLGGIQFDTDAIAQGHVGVELAGLVLGDLGIGIVHDFNHGLELKELNFAQILVEMGFDLFFETVFLFCGHQ